MEAHGNLTGELTGFVGRRAELALVRQSLTAARLVTLTGPGGIGKTRLALRAATAARGIPPPGGRARGRLSGVRGAAG